MDGDRPKDGDRLRVGDCPTLTVLVGGGWVVVV